MDMAERVKYARNEALGGMNQADFAKLIGVSKISVSYYENGKRSPSKALCKVIADKSEINERWMLTGEGSPKKETSKNDEIAKITKVLYEADPDGIQYKLIKLLADMSTEQWEMVRNLIDELSK